MVLPCKWQALSKVLLSILPTQTTDERNEATVHDRNFVEGSVVYTLLMTFCMANVDDRFFLHTANVTTGILTASFSWLLCVLHCPHCAWILTRWQVDTHTVRSQDQCKFSQWFLSQTDANTTPGLFTLAWWAVKASGRFSQRFLSQVNSNMH